MKKFKIKTGDTVQVMSGKDRGKKGKVLKIIRSKDRVIVEGVNIITKRVKPTAENPEGGLVEKEAPVHISNVMLVDPKSGEPTRVGYRFDENGNKKRYSKKTGEEF
ncbi:MAG: 50S ribosomal protein L24 [Chlorobi bacterium]|nr:50S ribosomal protein L24 [Chlorobiota bacterium]